MKFFQKHQAYGLLILRVGIGAMFMFHGFGKMTGGPELWSKVGAAMGYFGISWQPVLFGFLAMCAEFFGGACLILGLFFRWACLFLLFTMIVASTMHLASGDTLNVASHAIEAGIVFLGLMFSGPGPKSLDEKLSRRR